MIRAATIDDIPALISLGYRMHSESVYAPYSFNEAKVRKVLDVLMAGSGCVFVFERGGVILGYFLGILTEHWFGDSTLAADLALYVVPEHRGGPAAVGLLRAYMNWARLVGADDVQIAQSTGVGMERVGHLYQRLGFQPVGGIFKRGAACAIQ